MASASPGRLVKILKAGLKEEDNIMGTLVDYLIEQHKDIWLESGRQEGESRLIIRLLKRKFKIVPERYQREIEQANQADLLKWTDKILESQSLEEIFRE